jgi:hypothetical protein
LSTAALPDGVYTVDKGVGFTTGDYLMGTYTTGGNIFKQLRTTP